MSSRLFQAKAIFGMVCAASAYLTQQKPATKPNPLYELPTISLEEAKADPTQLSGIITIAYWLNDECSGNAVVTRTMIASGFELHSLNPLSENPRDNLYCLAAPESEGCDLVDTFYAYKKEDGYQLFVEDTTREYPYLKYGSCEPTQVYGDGVYFAFFQGGDIITDEIIVPGHDHYDIPEVSFEEGKKDPSNLSGLATVSLFATPDCSGPVEGTIPLPSTGGEHRISVWTPVSDDVRDDVYCTLETKPVDNCTPSPGEPVRHFDDAGVNIFFEGDNSREVIQSYSECVSQPNFRGSYILSPGGHGVTDGVTEK